MVDASNTLTMLGYHKAHFVFRGVLGLKPVESPSYKNIDTLFKETWGKCLWTEDNDYVWKIDIKKVGIRQHKIIYHSILSTIPKESKESFSSYKEAIEFLS